MNAENFPLFLRNPERLWTLNFHELKSLVLEHPYSANLRLLLAQKAHMEEHPEADALLAMAATYHSDRRQLQWQMRMLPKQRPDEEPTTIEEILELRPLNELLPLVPEPSELNIAPPEAAPPQAAFEVPPTITEVDPPLEQSAAVLTLNELLGQSKRKKSKSDEQEELRATVMDSSLNLAALIDFTSTVPEAVEEELMVPVPTASIIVPGKLPTPVYQLDMNAAKSVAAAVGIVDTLTFIEPARSASIIIDLDVTPATTMPAADYVAPKPDRTGFNPLPSTALPGWRAKYEPTHLSTLTELLKEDKQATEPPPIKAKKKKKAKRRKDKPSEVARRSLEQDEELASETLAQLLEQQGHIDLAVDMYERLRLSMPEKNGFFAAKIKMLRDLD